MDWMSRMLSVLRSFRMKWRGIEIVEDATFLVSYPRSGNTWVRQMLTAFKHPDAVMTPELMAQTVPDLHRTRDFVPGRSYDLVKSHELYVPDYPRVIYICRDGRDVAVSYYNFLVTAADYEQSFDTFFGQYLEGEMQFGSWHHHVESWVLTRHEKPLHVVKYEELCADTLGQMAKMIDFLGWPFDEANLQQAVASSAFRKRREYIEEHHPNLYGQGYQGGIKGGPGAWKKALTDEHLWLYFKQAGDVHNQLGYPCPDKFKHPDE